MRATSSFVVRLVLMVAVLISGFGSVISVPQASAEELEENPAVETYAAESIESLSSAPEDVVPQVDARLATVDLKVGSGQQYGSLQAAINAIPATPTSNYRILVYPGTYLSETTLTGKNNGPAGAAILIQNAQAEKPIFTGATSPTTWTRLSGTSSVYYTTSAGAKMVTDGVNRLNKAASLSALQRGRNVWFASGSTVYVKLYDYGDPNKREIHVTTGASGLNVKSVPNVLVEGLIFEHYTANGITFDNSGSSSARSVWVRDVGTRGANNAGVLFKSSPNAAALNIIGTSIYGSAVMAVDSKSLDVYNGSFHHSVNGVELQNSTGVLMQNNVYGAAMENPVKIDNASRAGLNTGKNTYWNPSGALGEVNGTAKYTVSSLGSSAGGEVSSGEADPLFRSTTTRESDKTNFLHNTVRDLDSALFGGNAWSKNTNAANLRWDQGFMFESYLDMYRATGDMRWLEKIVDQADNVVANCYDNAASPGSSDDGYCGWSTSRYARAMIKPSVTTSGQGVTFQVLDSSGNPVNGDLGIYGPGNADSLLSKTIELRFDSPSQYDVWDVTGTPVTLASNVSYSGAGLSPWVLDDPTVESAVNYDVKVRFCCTSGNDYPVGGDVYVIQTKAKKQLEYENIDGGLLAPLIEFAVEVKNDPTIQSKAVAGSTYLAKAQEYIDLVADNIYPKWDPYFKSSGSSGWYGGPGGIYRWPTDEQYAIPGNTLPVNQSTDLAQLWVRMYQATGQIKYRDRAISVGEWFKNKLEVQTAPDGKSFYYWRYYYPAGTWDSWNEVIPEDVNHGGVVMKFVSAAHEAGLVFTDADLDLFGNTFSSQLWDPVNGYIYWYLDRTTPGTIASRIYYFHSWLEMGNTENVARLVYDTYANNSYYTLTGVVYQMMSDAALAFSKLAGSENYRLRSGSPAIRSGNYHNYDRDFDGRVRSQLGVFDRGAFSYVYLDRVYGDNRYKTAISVSESQFAQEGSANTVLIARGDNFADALAGAPLAAQENGPILLTDTNAVQAEVLDEIKRVLPSGKTVWILGGTAAVSDSVRDQIQASGYTVKRLAGDDRYQTAVEISLRLNNLTQVFLASGTSFPDALAASSVAARDRAAIVLTQKDSLPDTTKWFLGHTPAEIIHVIGGTAVVSDKVANAATSYGSVDRVAGKNRYETSVKVAETYYPGADTVGFATGTSFPDSLVAGPFVGSPQQLAPLLLVRPDEVPEEIAAYLKANVSSVVGGLIFGGPAAVSDAVETALEAAL